MTTTNPSAAPAPAAKPLLVIEPPAGWAPINLRELWRFRELLFTLAGRDVKLRYRQTILGPAWVVLQPVLAAAIFAFVFGLLGRFKPPGDVPYFLFALTSMVGWNVFSSTMIRTSGSMVSNAHLVSKVYFPRVALPLGNSVSTLIDFSVGMTLVLVILLARGRLPGLNVLMLPVCVLLILALATGIGLCASALAVSYRDVQFIIPVVSQLLLYLSPVGYAALNVRERVPARYRDLYFLNPMANLLEAYRWSLLSIGEVRWGYFCYSAVVALAALVVGAYVFNQMERRFADVV